MKTVKSFIIIGQLLFLLACDGSSNKGSTDEGKGDDTTTSSNPTTDNKNEESKTSENGDADKIKRYGIKSGIVKYKLIGTQEGEESIYFDQWGLREAKFNKATIKIGNTSQSNETLTILNSEGMYTIDLINKTGLKSPYKILDQLKTLAASSGGDLAIAGMKMLEAMGGKKQGTEEFLGKSCEVWFVKATETKMWIWKGITLKSTINIMGMKQTTEAIDIQSDASVPEDKFKVPEGIKISDKPNIIK